MHRKFDHKAIEGKWQRDWAESGIYATDSDSDKPKCFVLDMFPYPSGEGLHVGHPKGYIATDIYSRFKRMTGHEVLHPMGWDAFGLPAENYAIKNKVHPRAAVEKNVANFKSQLAKLGFDYDWGREINTTDPEFYKWTQWIFIQLLKKGLAFQSHEPINWCPGCQTGLANEDLESDGTCERCDSVVEKKPMRQWVLNIRAYADRMLEDLDTLEWPEHIKEAQRNWIGRSEGAEIDFEISIPKTKPKALILHGFAGDPQNGWKPWLATELEKRGYEVRNPKLPNFDSPNYDEVMSFLREQTADFTDSDILIGHSLGCHFAMKLAEEKAFGKLVCVAPSFSLCDLPFDIWRKNLANFDVESAIKIIQEHPIDESSVKLEQKIAIFGAEDQGVPVENTKKLNAGWKTVVLPKTGHMSDDLEISEILRASTETVTVFTTRPDTLYGATYMVLAPEHELVVKHQESIANWSEVEAYIKEAANKKEMDRLDDTKEKTGVKLEGITATNPASGEEIPVYIADYVLAGYGTGAIMAVPAHDERDFAFATKFGIEIKQVIRKVFGTPLPDAVERTAAGVFIYDPENDKYLIQFSKEFKKHIPVFGGVEEGESYKEAAIRETKEETGYDTKFIKYIGGEVESHFYHPGKKTNRALLSRVALLHITKSNPEEISEKEKAKHENKWVTLNEMEELFNDERNDFDLQNLKHDSSYTGHGNLCNSGQFDGMDSEEVKKAIVEKVGGRMTKTYKIKDWVFSRQRYWGEPIPVVHAADGTVYPIATEQLPVTLPEVDHYEPAGDGQSPLAKIADWLNVTGYVNESGDFVVSDSAPDGQELLEAKRETNTMPQWAGSSWYYLRYIDPNNEQVLVDPTLEKEWQPVDVYVGGDHAVRHLIYARFWHKFLYDEGVVSTLEPFQRLEFLGFILAEDGRKMSKRWGNVINPDDIVELVGADTLRVYEMFMGPFENTIAWSQDGLVGARRFLERVNGLNEHVLNGDVEESKETIKQLHKTIKKVSEDIEAFKFNTAVSAMMIFINTAEKEGLSDTSYATFLQLLAPFAPHLTEELWRHHGKLDSIHANNFPTYVPELAKDDQLTIGVQINGKVRGDITIAPDATEEEAVNMAVANTTLKEKLGEAPYKKVIYVPGRILNIIV